jgi:hypothetical protein
MHVTVLETHASRLDSFNTLLPGTLSGLCLLRRLPRSVYRCARYNPAGSRNAMRQRAGMRDLVCRQLIEHAAQRNPLFKSDETIPLSRPEVVEERNQKRLKRADTFGQKNSGP